MEPRRRINLLPAEVGEKQQQRQAWVIAIIALGGLVAVLALITIWRAAQAKSVRDKATKQEAIVKDLERKAADLQYLDELQDSFEKQKQLVQTAWGREVSWPKVLQEMAAVMPDGVYLNSYTGTADQTSANTAPAQADAGKPGASTAPTAGKPAAGGTLKLTDHTALGKVDFQGSAVNQRAVGNWLYRINRGMPSLTYAWVQNSTQVGGTTTTTGSAATQVGVSFQSSAYLTPYAMGWMGRCAARGFENLGAGSEGACGHSFYGATSSGSTPAAPR